MRTGWQRYLVVLSALLLLGSAAFAATEKATIMGSVFDLSGAKGLSGIRVELKSDSIKFVREVVTDADGTYAIEDVPPADDYRITAFREKAPIDSTTLSLAVGDEKMILPPLREHPTEAVITVETPTNAPAGTPSTGPAKVQRIVVGGSLARARVDNEVVSTTISGVIKGDQLRGLPLANRNFLALGLLTPESHDVEAGSPLAGATFSLSGSRPNTNMFLLDGIDNVARSSNQAIPFQVNEAVQEFRVVSSTPNAEYGGASGGIVNVVTQRGTSKWHGNMFGYMSRDVLNSNPPLSVYSGSGYDLQSGYAGSTSNPNLSFSPATYNDYAATAGALAGAGIGPNFCTSSIARTQATGTFACNGSPTGYYGFGKNAFFDDSAIRAANDSRYAPYDSRQYGLNSGGAVLKDKLFVFGSYEGTIIDNPNPIFERVPTSFDKTYNPLLAAQIPSATNYAFSSSDPNYQFAQRILNLFPASNVTAVPGVLEYYKGFAPNYTHVHNGLLRGDMINTRTGDWTFRYVAQNLNQLHDDTLPKGNLYPGNGAIRDAFNQSILVGNSHKFGTSISSDFRVGFTRFRVNELPQDQAFSLAGFGLPGNQMMTFALSGIDPQTSGATPRTLGAMSSWTDSYWDYLFPTRAGFSCANTPCAPGTFQFFNVNSMFPTLDGQFPMARIGAPLSAPSQRRDSTVLAEEGLSMRKGHHSWKAGASWMKFGNRVNNGGLARGLVVSSNIGEFTSDSESSIFYNAQTAQLAFIGGPGAFRSPSYDFALRQNFPYVGHFGSYGVGAYLQDSWRVSSRVNINAGLRYDYFSIPTERDHNTWNFDPVANGTVQDGSKNVVDSFGTPCVGSGVNNATFGGVYSDNSFTLPWKCFPNGSGKIGVDSNGLQPRIGVAWDVFGHGTTVVRGGYAVMLDHQPVSTYSQLLFNRPSPVNTAAPTFTYGRNFDSSFCIACGLGNATVNFGAIPLNRAQFQAAASPLAISAIDGSRNRTPWTRQASFTLQQKLNSKVNLEVGYVGTEGDNLPTVYNSSFRNEFSCIISCDNAVPVFTMANVGESHYHSLLARVRTANFKGLAVNATYVFSKGLDNASSSQFPLIPITLRTSVYGFASNALGVPGASAFGSTIGGTFTNGTIPGATQNGTGSAGSTFADALNAGLTTTGAGQVFVSRYDIPQDPLNYLKDDYGRSDFDVAHRFVLDYSWDLPFLNGSGARANWFGHWRVSGIGVVQTGQPFTVFAGPIGGELTQRANLTAISRFTGTNSGSLDPGLFTLPGNATGALSCNHGFAVTTGLFNPARAVTPCTGTSRRNQFTGSNYGTLDMAVQKGIQVAEGKSLSLRAEFFNLTNRDNLYNPISLLSKDGTSVNPDFGKVKSAHNPRQIQLAIRFAW